MNAMTAITDMQRDLSGHEYIGFEPNSCQHVFRDPKTGELACWDNDRLFESRGENDNGGDE